MAQNNPSNKNIWVSISSHSYGNQLLYHTWNPGEKSIMQVSGLLARNLAILCLWNITPKATCLGQGQQWMLHSLNDPMGWGIQVEVQSALHTLSWKQLWLNFARSYVAMGLLSTYFSDSNTGCYEWLHFYNHTQQYKMVIRLDSVSMLPRASHHWWCKLWRNLQFTNWNTLFLHIN